MLPHVRSPDLSLDDTSHYSTCPNILPIVNMTDNCTYCPVNIRLPEPIECDNSTHKLSDIPPTISSVKPINMSTIT